MFIFMLSLAYSSIVGVLETSVGNTNDVRYPSVYYVMDKCARVQYPFSYAMTRVQYVNTTVSFFVCDDNCTNCQLVYNVSTDAVGYGKKYEIVKYPIEDIQHHYFYSFHTPVRSANVPETLSLDKTCNIATLAQIVVHSNECFDVRFGDEYQYSYRYYCADEAPLYATYSQKGCVDEIEIADDGHDCQSHEYHDIHTTLECSLI